MAESSGLELETVRVLINQAREGDDRAQSELINQVQTYLSIMADRNLNNSLRAKISPSDIVQQTLIKMVNGINDFKGETTNEFYGWLNQIIKNESLKAQRDLTRQKRDIRRQQHLGSMVQESGKQYDLHDDMITPQTNAIANERIELFHQALGNLSGDHATVIRLRNLELLPFKEIAIKMGRTVDSVTKIWYRAVLKFEKELEALNDKTR